MRLGHRSTHVLTYLFNSVITHCPIGSIRLGWLRLLGAKCPKSVQIYRGVEIFGPAQLVFGERVVVGYHVCLDARGGIVIGDDSVIASYCHLLTADHDVDCPQFRGRFAPIQIGRNCWVCTRSLLLKGIEVDDFAVIAANSVVTKSVPSNHIVGGTPAKYLRVRECNVHYKIPM